jgi:hypothetical protein
MQDRCAFSLYYEHVEQLHLGVRVMDCAGDSYERHMRALARRDNMNK